MVYSYQFNVGRAAEFDFFTTGGGSRLRAFSYVFLIVLDQLWLSHCCLYNFLKHHLTLVNAIAICLYCTRNSTGENLVIVSYRLRHFQHQVSNTTACVIKQYSLLIFFSDESAVLLSSYKKLPQYTKL